MSSEGAASILRAVGSLLLALSGTETGSGSTLGQVGRALGEMQAQQPDPGAQPPSSAIPPPLRQAQRPVSDPRVEPAPRPRPQGAQPQGHVPPPRTSPAASAAEHHPAEHHAVASNRSDATGAPGEMLDEVEFVLADARERAQRIIDESMEHARELIAQERATAAPVTGIDPRAFDDLRRGLHGLVTEVRDIQQRLSRIEALLREQNDREQRREASAPEWASSAPTYTEQADGEPADAEPRYAETDTETHYTEARGAGPQDDEGDEPTFETPYLDADVTEPAIPGPSAAWGAPVPPRSPAYEPEVATAAEEDEYAGDSAVEAPAFPSAGSDAPEPDFEEDYPPAPAVAPAPPRSTFSVVPPQRREWLSEREDDARAAASEPPYIGEVDELAEDREAGTPAYGPGAFEPAGITGEPEARASGSEWDDDEFGTPVMPAAGVAGSPLVTFLPSDGAITLRVAPVAGFQDLMRIQDALTRLPVIRRASVEAYSQGEARLRIELADTSDSDEIAQGLGRALRGPARVEDASEVNRELLIALR